MKEAVSLLQELEFETLLPESAQARRGKTGRVDQRFGTFFYGGGHV